VKGVLNLVLVRHAEAAAQTPLGTDGERSLTAAGEKASVKLGRILAEFPLPNARVVCSPKLRAKRTAAILAEAIGAGEPHELDCLLGGRDPDAILNGLPRGAGIETLIVVGHEPDMGHLLARLIDPAWHGTIPFATAGFAWVEIGALPPHHAGRLRLFGDSRSLAPHRESSAPASS
jgi:phosphohistidine phosphatase